MKVFRSVAAVVAAGALLVWAAVAAAQNLAGTYNGTGDATGTTLELTLNGTALIGIFTGDVTGTLTAETDGGTNATGIVFINGNTKARIRTIWADAGLTIFVAEQGGGEEEVFFARAGATPPAPPVAPTKPTQVTPTPTPVPAPAPAPTPAPTPVADVGNLDALLGAIRTMVADEMAAATDIERAAVVQCLFTLTGDLPPPERQALIDAGFNPNAELIGRLEQLVPGISDRVADCFDAPEPTVPPASAAVTPAPDDGRRIIVELPPPDELVNAALNAVIVAFVEDELDGDPADIRATAVACITAAVTDLPIEERQLLVDRNFDPNAEQIDRLEALKPGITDLVEGCLSGEAVPDETAVHEQLRDVVVNAVATMFNDATPTQQADMVACLLEVYAMLTEADVRLMVETQLDPPIDERQRIMTAYPNFATQITNCALPPTPPRAP